MTGKQVRAQYTREYKLEAVRQVQAGQAISVVAKVLSIPKASLGNWVRQADKGNLDGAGDKPATVTAEQMELVRLRAENARLSFGSIRSDVAGNRVGSTLRPAAKKNARRERGILSVG